MKKVSDVVAEMITAYWMTHYVSEHCTLCGNAGIIDTRGIKTNAGLEVGRLNWCVCPNGQTLRDFSGGKLPTQQDLEWRRS